MVTCSCWRANGGGSFWFFLTFFALQKPEFNFSSEKVKHLHF